MFTAVPTTGDITFSAIELASLTGAGCEHVMWPHKPSDTHPSEYAWSGTNIRQEHAQGVATLGASQLSPYEKINPSHRGAPLPTTVSLGSSRRERDRPNTNTEGHIMFREWMYADSTQAGWWQVSVVSP
jgi:hypothetical protein